jgi:hypothetical protein
VIEVDGLFPERDEPDAAMTEAIAAVCARLGRPVEVAVDGEVNTIVGGVVDGERVAWVEQRWRSAGYEDIDGYTLRTREWAWEVDTYNPWFGCTVHCMRWYGDELAVVYSEKHLTIACVLDRGGAPRMRAVDYRWRLVGDTLVYASDARGLVERISLPELAPWAPLPALVMASELSAGTGEPLAPLCAERRAFWREVARRLPKIDERFVELLIGSLAYRFWEPREPVATTYQEVYSADRGWNTPCWLAFYWVRTRAGAEGRARLAELDAIAGRRPMACGSGLAAACRAGRLPDGVSCYFWVDWSQAGFVAAEPLFPPGMWAAWLELRGSGPGLLALANKR